MKVRIAKAMPGCPAGTVFDLDKDGNYRSTDGEFWFSPGTLIHNQDFIVQPPIEAGTVYHYIDDAGVVVSAEWADTKRDEARKRVGNYFEQVEDAKAAAIKTAEALGGKALTDEATAALISERVK